MDILSRDPLFDGDQISGALYPSVALVNGVSRGIYFRGCFGVEAARPEGPRRGCGSWEGYQTPSLLAIGVLEALYVFNPVEDIS